MPRTYHSKNLNERQQEFVRLLDEFEIDIFSISEIEKWLGRALPGLQEVVENLVRKDFLSRIERGKYCRFNFRDESVIGCFIAKAGAVSYWTALNKHGLTEQFPNTIFIQAASPKDEKTIFGVKYQFIHVAKSKRTGIVSAGYGNHSYRITDREKTIADCFDLPQYSGGYAELIRAYAETRLDSDKMIAYCKAIHNIAATKRMGFLAEHLNKEGLESFVRFARKKVNQAYNLFDPLGADEGEFVNEWRLRLNVTREEISDICNKIY
jgi:predicted transcriptional regulator of viral defense system